MNDPIKKTPILHRLIRILFPLALLAAGGGAWAYFQATAPKMERKMPEAKVWTVEVLAVKTSQAPAVISAMGTVTASREVALKARVAGDVIYLSPRFVPGGLISKGKEILRLDPSDYEVEVKKAESALEKAQADLTLEQGSQTIAREELRLLRETSMDGVAPTDLVLRKPQLQQAKASVASAKADLRKARLDLKRTKVTAPFNAMIIERNVNLGSHVASQGELATIVDTDEYWIKAVIPLDQLKNLDLDREGGCPAVIRSQAYQGAWEGRAVRAAGKLSETSRMATVIVVVSDPLGLKSGGEPERLMLDDYVSVKIEGRTLDSVIDLPRAALRDGDTVWVENNGTLDIRPVTLAMKQGDRVFVNSGLETGDRVVISDLSTPVKGMKIQVMDDSGKMGETGSGVSETDRS